MRPRRERRKTDLKKQNSYARLVYKLAEKMGKKSEL